MSINLFNQQIRYFSSKKIRFPISPFELSIKTVQRAYSPKESLFADGEGNLVMADKALLKANVQQSFELAMYHFFLDLSSTNKHKLQIYSPKMAAQICDF
jgi:hypothetical protein